MAKNNRALAFPRTFSIMVSEATGKCVDLLRVVESSKTYRASVADSTRRLLDKGMAVEALERAMTYATGRHHELLSGLLADVAEAMGEALPSSSPDEVLRLVLGRMWPDLAPEVDRIDVTRPAGRLAHAKLLAPSPMTAKGRAKTAEEIRLAALHELSRGQVEAPRLVPPKTVQQARERARLEIQADRVAMERGVPVAQLLADTAGGKAVGMPLTDESAGAQDPGTQASRGKKHGTGRTPEAAVESYGEQLKRMRGKK